MGPTSAAESATPLHTTLHGGTTAGTESTTGLFISSPSAESMTKKAEPPSQMTSVAHPSSRADVTTSESLGKPWSTATATSTFPETSTTPVETPTERTTIIRSTGAEVTTILSLNATSQPTSTAAATSTAPETTTVLQETTSPADKTTTVLQETTSPAESTPIITTSTRTTIISTTGNDETTTLSFPATSQAESTARASSTSTKTSTSPFHTTSAAQTTAMTTTSTAPETTIVLQETTSPAESTPIISNSTVEETTTPTEKTTITSTTGAEVTTTLSLLATSQPESTTAAISTAPETTTVLQETTSPAEKTTAVTTATTVEETTTVTHPTTSPVETTTTLAITTPVPVVTSPTETTTGVTSILPLTSTVHAETSLPSETTRIPSISTEAETTTAAPLVTYPTTTTSAVTSSLAETSTVAVTVTSPAKTTLTLTPTTAAPKASTSALETNSPSEIPIALGTTTERGTPTASPVTTVLAETTKTSSFATESERSTAAPITTTPAETTRTYASTTTSSSFVEETTTASPPTTALPGSMAVATSTILETSTAPRGNNGSHLCDNHNIAFTYHSCFDNTTKVEDTATVALPTTSAHKSTAITTSTIAETLTTLRAFPQMRLQAATGTTAVGETATITLPTTSAHESTAIATSPIPETSTTSIGTTSVAKTTAISSTSTAEETTTVLFPTVSLPGTMASDTSLIQKTSTALLETTSLAETAATTNATTLEETTTVAFPSTSLPESTAVAWSLIPETSTASRESTSLAEITAITSTTIVEMTTMVALPTVSLPQSTTVATSASPETSTAALESTSLAETAAITTASTVRETTTLPLPTISQPESTAAVTAPILQTSTATLKTTSLAETTAIASTTKVVDTATVALPTTSAHKSTAITTSTIAETLTTPVETTSAAATTATTSSSFVEETTTASPPTTALPGSMAVATSTILETSTAPVETTFQAQSSGITGSSTVEETTPVPLPTTFFPKSSPVGTSTIAETLTTPLETGSSAETTAVTTATTVEETTTVTHPTTSPVETTTTLAITTPVPVATSPTETTTGVTSILPLTSTVHPETSLPSETTRIPSISTEVETTTAASLVTYPTATTSAVTSSLSETSTVAVMVTSPAETTVMPTPTTAAPKTSTSVLETNSPSEIPIALGTTTERGTPTASPVTTLLAENTKTSSIATAAERSTMTPISTTPAETTPTYTSTTAQGTTTSAHFTTSPAETTTTLGVPVRGENNGSHLCDNHNIAFTYHSCFDKDHICSCVYSNNEFQLRRGDNHSFTSNHCTTWEHGCSYFDYSRDLHSSSETTTSARPTSSPAESTTLISTSTSQPATITPPASSMSIMTVAATSATAETSTSPLETTFPAMTSSSTVEETTAVPLPTSTLIRTTAAATSTISASSIGALETSSPNETSAVTAVSPTSTTASAIEHFTVNFTITNLKYDSQLRSPHSTRFNATEKVLISLLNPIFGNSSFGPDYIKCEVTSYRSVRDGNNTGVDAVCTYRHDSTAPLFDRVDVYHEIQNKTNGITKLGLYTLDKDSLYVNGYNEAPDLPTVLPTSTPAPAIVRFTVNFTITNLKYDSQLGTPHSTRFNATEKVLISLLNPIFENSSIGPAYIRCEVIACRSVRDGNNTGVDAVCTYRHGSTAPPFDRVGVYHEIRNKTNGITKLGPYTLDKDSLYVNGYNEAPAMPTVLPTSTPVPAIGHFTVNFTITNLKYDSQLGTPHSTRFNATEKVLISLLNPIFKNSSIGPEYIRCEVTTYRPVRAGNDTGVDAVCTYRRDSTAPPFDRVSVYHEIQNKTNGITKLGPYTLDEDSLYVNGYNEAPALPTVLPTSTPTPAIERFTVNFTITNLKYDSQLGTPHSTWFNATEKVLISLLNPIFENSSIGPAYIRCEVIACRSVRDGNNTGVDAVCTYRHGSTAPVFDRVGVYHEIRNKTNGITNLGPYTLDKDSLYVNGYNEAPALPTVLPTSAPVPAIERFTVNFTITNLKYNSQLGTPHSTQFNATEKALISLLNPILNNSSIGPAYIKCEVTAYRLVRAGNDTGVDAVCTYRRDSTTPPFDRVGVYHEIQNKTNGITKLGPYNLDKDSLYVNGYNEAPAMPTVLPTSTPVPAIGHFTVNFTITNLKYNSQLGTPHSTRFNATEKVLISLLNPIFKNSSIGPEYIRCEVTAYRPVRAGNDTGVDAVCTYRHDSTAPLFDRVGVYHEIQNKTNGITKLGPYTLDEDSLYVNGYNEAPALPTVLPTSTLVPAIERFTVNFTITNLKYNSQLGTPHSTRFNAIEKVLISLLNPIFKNSSIGPEYIRCEVTAYRPVRAGNDTGVDAVCTYRRDSTTPPFDRVSVYHEIQNKTNGITKLGPYTLDEDSLYVNGYNEAPALPTVLPTSTPVPAIERFTVNFTITNLKYNSQLGTPHSTRFNATEKVLISLLNPIFKNSSIGPAYIKCEVTAYRSMRAGNDTGVDAVCTYRRDSTAPSFDRMRVYHEVRNKTNGITKLGPYILDKDSLYVNGYNEANPPPTVMTTTIPAPTVDYFTVNFTITNLQYTFQLGTPNSNKFNATEKVLTSLLDPLFKNSSIGPVYMGCKVMTYRPVNNGDDTSVDALCTYRTESTTSRFDRVRVYHELSNKTSGITKLGPYSLDDKSLYVNGYNEPRSVPTTIPTATSASAPTVKHFTVNFTITNLQYTSQLGTPNSLKFNNTEKVLTSLLDPLLTNSSIGSDYKGCKLFKIFQCYKWIGKKNYMKLTCPFVPSPVTNGDGTRIDALCTYRNDFTRPRFDRAKVYHELSNKTRDITKLGPYNLDNSSLYVNEYNEALLGPTLSQTTPQSPTAGYFTVNATLTNLRYTTDLGTPGSRKFNSTEKTILYHIEPLLRKSSIGPIYTGCKVMAFRSVRNRDDTGVDAFCSYRNEPTAPKFDRVKIYRELSSMTKNITKLGQYNLENKSLYVNEYNEALLGPTLSQTTPQSPTAGYFTVNATLTNLRYTTDLGTPGSRKFNSTEKTILYYIEPMLRNSSIGPVYTGCKVMAFRSMNNKDTGINAVCSYKNNSTVATFDRVKLYNELSSMTKGITTLGPYTLEKNGLYVNGFRLSDIATTTEAPSMVAPENVGYLLNFRIINVNLTSPDPKSLAYQALQKDIAEKINQLYRKSDLQGRFLFCNVTGLRIGSVVVDCNCHFKPAPNRSEETVLSTFQNGTRNASAQWLGGRYQLQGARVNVLETVIKPVTQPPVSAERETFRLNFTVTNLFYSSELKQPSSNPHRLNKQMIEKALDNIFRNSSVQKYFAGCSVESFRPISGKTYTGINAICKFMLDSTSRAFQREEVYEEFKRLTNGGTQLGDSYTLDKDSLLVNDYSPLNTMAGEPGRSANKCKRAMSLAMVNPLHIWDSWEILALSTQRYGVSTEHHILGSSSTRLPCTTRLLLGPKTESEFEARRDYQVI
ncbi:mucin-16 [Gopherus evgoodei]|uniref:mucin-16 n=1 Tax=Gopherus evgoodei TaxID=1825980 RepID=UPI0011CEFBE9|nr:mucin-16 [Gopherus evgoodei]